MATKVRFQLVLLLFLFDLPFKSGSSSLQRELDYNRWVSWNVENHWKKTMLRAAESASQARGTGGQVLDVELRNAEMNKVSISVSQDGTGDYKTVNDALNSIPFHNTRRVILEIKPGNSSDPPTITGNDTASTPGRNGIPLKTFQSATVAVDANYFVAINMKFENTAPHEVGSVGGQAVALRISGTKAAFYNCSFYGTQDTLYDHKGLHYFNNCFIQGSVDFIFGYGTSLYENCYLNSIAKKVASLTAQKRTKSSLASGFSFKDCIIEGSGMVYLGRAWGDYSRVVFSYTFMDKLVLPQGWNDWAKHKRNMMYYGEYKCRGPGANFTGRVPWARMLTDEEAMPFIGTYYVEGDAWLISP